jgi:hypothetical protein
MERAALYFNDEGLEAEQRGKELLKYYVENLKPNGEVPYLLYDIPELAGKSAASIGSVAIPNATQRDLIRELRRAPSSSAEGTSAQDPFGIPRPFVTRSP